jgi:Xaa-Pro aminopeptidase
MSIKEKIILKRNERTYRSLEGEKLTKERALAVSGIKTVYWLQTKNLVRNDDLFDTIYINTNEHYRAK